MFCSAGSELISLGCSTAAAADPPLSRFIACEARCLKICTDAFGLEAWIDHVSPILRANKIS